MEPFAFDWSYHLFSTIFLALDLTIRIGLSIRVIMRKRPYGVSLAWLVIILLFPFIGGFFYLLFGENRIPERRAERLKISQRHYQHWLQTLHNRAPVDWQQLNPECVPLHKLALTHTGLPAMAGNNLELLATPDEVINAIIADIDSASSTCHLLFYIWEEGGRVDEVNAALIRAASRGVVCRLLLDAIGSRNFLKSKAAASMREAGIRIQEALPARILKALLSRVDIRNHRKIVVIDGIVAYTGSQNMVDPEHFKQDAGVGNWVDIMVRVQGPVVESLAGTFINDWFLEADISKVHFRSLTEDLQTVRETADIHNQDWFGEVPVQLVPSGPGIKPDTIHSLLLTAIYAARKTLVLTTPYFIPDDALLSALKSASLRGVAVTIVLPAKNESRLAEYATRARYEELLEAGVHLQLYTAGFLHAKTITVDGDVALLGSVNLDMRSFWLNFESTLLIYDPGVCSELQQLQQQYISLSSDLDLKTFMDRSIIERLKENAVLLIGPLL